MSTHHVFTYGTLKTGEVNHIRFQRQGIDFGRSIGVARTVENYPLVLATRFKFPFLLDARGGHRVIGEVLEVNDKTLEFLDTLECCPKLYERVEILVELLPKDAQLSTTSNDPHDTTADSGPAPHNDGTMKCYAYVLKGFKKELLDLPFLEEYKCPFGSLEDYREFLRSNNHTRQDAMRESMQLKGIDVDMVDELPIQAPL